MFPSVGSRSHGRVCFVRVTVRPVMTLSCSDSAPAWRSSVGGHRGPWGSCPKKVPFSGSAVDPRSLIADELWRLLVPGLHLNKKGLSWGLHLLGHRAL